MTQNNDVLTGLMGTSATGATNNEELVSQMRVISVRYKVYAAIILVILAILFLQRLPSMQSTFDATNAVYKQTQSTLQQLAKDKIAAQRDKAYLEEIEATQSILETCLNKEEATACASLPTTWNITYKGKTLKDFSVPLAYLQLNSLYTPKMPIDEKKVLRNLNEYLIRDGIVQGVNIKNGDIETINIGDPIPMKGSSVFFSVPLTFSIKFQRVGDLISFVRNVEKKLITIPEDRIFYKIQEVGYDIVSSDQPQTANLSMTAYYYHDPRFQDLPPAQTPPVGDTTGENALPSSPSEEALAMLGDCEDFPENLKSCKSYSCEFTDASTQEIMKRDIIGMVSGKCKYIEMSSHDKKMTCNYTESQRTTAGNYYVTLFADLQQNVISTATTPIQKFITDGVCVMS